jgi:hypothetical protein
MAKTLSRALGTDLAPLAELLRSKGRGKDTILAHINPREAALLKRAGGSGDINPDTGLPEFYTEDDSFGDYGGSTQPDDSYVDTSSGSGSTQPDAVEDTNVVPVTASGYEPGYVSRGMDVGEAPMASGDEISAPQAVRPGYGLSGGRTAYTPAPVTPAGLQQLEKGQMPTELEGLQKPSLLDRAGQAVSGMKAETLGRLGLAGGLGLLGAQRAKQGAAQGQAVTAEQKAIAQPYTEAGQKLMTQAQAGQMTPQSQAALNAAKAQIAQSVANRGGVGQQQAANQIAQLQANLLDNQYKYGLQVAQIGDNITLGAIRTGLQLDRQMQANTQNFYTQLAQIAAGGNYALPTTLTGVK